jgi:hypothetical protein
MKQSMFFNDYGVRYAISKIIISKNMEVRCDSTRGKKLIGTNLISAIVDEVNFGASAQVSASHLQRGEVKTLGEIAYEGINRRIKSRYMSLGQTPGILFLVSSSNSDADFTRKRINQARNDPSSYVMAFAEWETKLNKFSGERFRVFFGGNTFRSRILTDDEVIENYSLDENARVIEVPVEYRSDFERNIEDALRDIAGVSVPHHSLFIQNYEAIETMFNAASTFRAVFGTAGGGGAILNGLPKALNTLTWFSGDPSPFNWSSFCHSYQSVDKYGIKRTVSVPRLNKDTPRVIHLDPALTKDKFGFTMGHINRMVDMVLRDKNIYKESLPEIILDFTMQIAAPPDGEINFQQVRRLIYELRDHGFYIAMITMDGWNTIDMRQTLSAEGFATEITSLDITTEGYDYFKSALYQKRVIAAENPELRRELMKLEFNAVKKKVDHPKIDEGRPGSKDVADSAAGVVWCLSKLLPMPALSPEYMAEALQPGYEQQSEDDKYTPSPSGQPERPAPSDLPPWLYNR